MKKRGLILLLVAVISFFALCGFDKDRDFNIVAGDDYLCCYSDKSYDKVIKRLNEIYNEANKENREDVFDDSQLENFFEKYDIQYFAVSKNDASQIRVAVISDETSEKISDLSRESNSRVKKFAKNLVGTKDLEYEIYQNDAKKYIMLKGVEEDAGGSYVVTQFVTVYNGKVFNISFYNADGMTDKEYKILNTFDIIETNFPSKMPVFIVILVAIGIAVLICLIIAMIWGLVHKKSKTADDVDPQNEPEQNQTPSSSL